MWYTYLVAINGLILSVEENPLFGDKFWVNSECLDQEW